MCCRIRFWTVPTLFANFKLINSELIPSMSVLYLPFFCHQLLQITSAGCNFIEWNFPVKTSDVDAAESNRYIPLGGCFSVLFCVCAIETNTAVLQKGEKYVFIFGLFQVVWCLDIAQNSFWSYWEILSCEPLKHSKGSINLVVQLS